MPKHFRADGAFRGNPTASPGVEVSALRPALASIPAARRYLGDLSRSRLYELMPQLDVVRIGARTFITVNSLDRLIAENMEPGTETPNSGKALTR